MWLITSPHTARVAVVGGSGVRVGVGVGVEVTAASGVDVGTGAGLPWQPVRTKAAAAVRRIRGKRAISQPSYVRDAGSYTAWAISPQTAYTP